MANSTKQANEKYTRGEYCITTHIFITFAILLLISFVFSIHLYITEHSTKNALQISSISPELIIQTDKPEYIPIGVVYLSASPDEVLCNSVLLRRRWSVAPAHCVMMHLQPGLAPLRSSWRVAYANNYSGYDETRIRRSIVHPGFLMSDFRNNIALLEHTIVVLDETFEYVFSKYIPITDGVLQKYSAAMSIAATNGLFEDNQEWNETIVKHLVVPFYSEECKELMKSIITLRSYEFCVTYTHMKNVTISHGAALVIKSKILGFFTWGDKKSSGVPFVILHIPFYRHWLESVIDAIRIDDEYY